MGSMVKEVISIDGSFGEGGGQVLRNSISFAAILNKTIYVNNIGAGRSKPGLNAQHVTALRLCEEIRGGLLEGCEIGSSQVSYTPPDEESSDMKISFLGDTKTAGSICLVLQAALPLALFARTIPTNLILRGGTNASMAPLFDYWEEIFIPTLLSRCDFPDNQIEHRVVRRGFFPRGHGEVIVEVSPWHMPLPPIALTTRGELCSIRIISYYASSVQRTVAIEMAQTAGKVLKDAGIGIEPDVEIKYHKNAVEPGWGIILVANTTTNCRLAGSSVGSPRKGAKQVGRDAAEELSATLRDGGCVDDWLQDQLILFMALASGVSEVLTGSLTLHTQTAIWVAEQLSGAEFEVKRLDGNSGFGVDQGYGKDGRIPGKHLIRCTGINFVNRPLHYQA